MNSTGIIIDTAHCAKSVGLTYFISNKTN